MQEPQQDAVLRQRAQRGFHRLHRAGDVRLDDDVDRLHAILVILRRGEVREGHGVPFDDVDARLVRARLGGVPRVRLAVHHVELLARRRHAAQTHDLHGRRRTRLLQLIPVRVSDGAHFAPMRANQHGVAHAQSPGLHEERGHGASLLVQVCLDDGAARVALGVGDEFLHLRHQRNGFEELVHAGALLRGDVDHRDVATPLLTHHFQRSELLLHAFGVGALLVDLVHGDDQRHARGARVRNRLLGLRPHAVVGGDDDDGDVGDARPARAHRRERLMTRRVQERDLTALIVDGRAHLVRADGLRDPASLARRNLRLADIVQQRRLAVVDVAHDGHHRRTGNQVLVVVLAVEVRLLARRDLHAALFLVDPLHVPRLGDGDHRVAVQDLAHLDRDAFHEEHLDHVALRGGEKLAQRLDGHTLRGNL